MEDGSYALASEEYTEGDIVGKGWFFLCLRYVLGGVMGFPKVLAQKRKMTFLKVFALKFNLNK